MSIMSSTPAAATDDLKCELCETSFKTVASLKAHQKKKAVCVTGERLTEIFEAKNAEMKEMKERMEMSEEHSDMFRKLHVRSQKQLAAWRKDHEKCSVTRQQEMEKEDTEEFTLEDKPRESFFKNDPPKSTAAPSNIRAPGQSHFNNYGSGSGSSGSGSGVPTSWSSSSENPSGGTTTTTTTTSSGGDNVIPDWAKQFQQAPWNQSANSSTALAPTRLPNGQIINPANMTTTNTTTTNVTNNIININVKLCAPGFESIDMTDSRGFNFTAQKKQEIADHLQRLLEIMMDDEPDFSHYDYGDHDYKKEVYPNVMS